MRSFTHPTRLAAAGATVALTAGALVGFAVSTAEAAAPTTDYTCQLPVVGPTSVPMTTSLPALPTLTAGQLVPAGALSTDLVFGIAPGVAGLLGTLSAMPSVTGMSFSAGDTAIPVQSFDLGSLVGSSITNTVSNGAFTAPAAGSYPVMAPESFNLDTALGSFPCATTAPAQVGTLTTADEAPAAPTESTTTATLKNKKIHKGKRARVSVTVARVVPVPVPGLPTFATGTVVVKKGKHKVGSGDLDPSTGAVKIRTSKFKKPGVYKLKVIYKGDQFSNGSRDKVRLKVTRHR